LRSRNFLALVSKEWRELCAARAFWLLLLMIGPLVGHGFIVAVNMYAEASGIGGGAAALAQGLTPLDGILVPTFGAYDLAATFLLPFVAIRMISAEKENGGLKLLLQFPGSLGAKMAAKGLALFGGWLIVLTPGLLAIVLWEIYGGHVYAPETANLLLGHFLRAMLNGGIALAAAALAESAASAAIVTLGITVGTWALDFIAAGRGGFLQQLASFTPTAALRFFEQGLLRLNTALVMLAISVAGFAASAIWLDMGRRVRSRAWRMTVLLIVLVVVMLGAANLRTSLDTSENRRNSFARADEEALARIRQPLHVTAFLAPEDPRLTDLEQSVLNKLRRILARVEVDYVAGGSSGLFEASGDHYGEIWYELNGNRVMERSTIEPVVLEQIYRLAGVSPPPHTEGNEFDGYPLAARPAGAALIFYGLWPLATILAWWLIRRERNTL
jgi:ABC-type transport system involved in multi-copper enzyme maturation permease subunit